jgi:PIN domain nuclease of toxin-antitoxin system
VTHLLDTHALVAFVADDRARLGPRARRLLERAMQGSLDVRVSAISLWEVALLQERGRLRIPAGFAAWSAALRRHPALALEPLVPADVEHARAYPSLVDPADRLIVGTALRLDATLVTRDDRITKSGVVRVLW